MAVGCTDMTDFPNCGLCHRELGELNATMKLVLEEQKHQAEQIDKLQAQLNQIDGGRRMAIWIFGAVATVFTLVGAAVKYLLGK